MCACRRYSRGCFGHRGVGGGVRGRRGQAAQPCGGVRRFAGPHGGVRRHVAVHGTGESARCMGTTTMRMGIRIRLRPTLHWEVSAIGHLTPGCPSGRVPLDGAARGRRGIRSRVLRLDGGGRGAAGRLVHLPPLLHRRRLLHLLEGTRCRFLQVLPGGTHRPSTAQPHTPPHASIRSSSRSIIKIRCGSRCIDIGAPNISR